MQHLRLLMVAVALLTAGFVSSRECRAADKQEALEEELEDLVRRTESLEAAQRAELVRDIRAYMEHSKGVGPRRPRGREAEAMGGPPRATGALLSIEGLTVHARATGVVLGTVNMDPSNRTVAHGVVEVDFDFAVTPNLNLFVDFAASTNDSFPAAFDPEHVPDVDFTTGNPLVFPATFSGIGDGIGVDGTVSTASRGLSVDEAGFLWKGGDVEVLMGKLDPRNHYAQNKFADDEHTQFLNNVFDDPPAISWPSTGIYDADGFAPTVFGLNFAMHFGHLRNLRLDVGHFNAPGRYWDQGFLMAQLTWTTELGRGEANFRLYSQYDLRIDSAGVGLSFDWQLTAKTGVFVRLTARDNVPAKEGETNPIESDWAIGVVTTGPFAKRPDDTLGLGFAVIKGNLSDYLPAYDNVAGNSEKVVELYYRLVYQKGGLQITPLAQLIVDPFGGSFQTSSLLFLGLRAHVRF